jgi:hypothetical protein
MERNIVKGKVMRITSKTRHAKLYLPFLLANSKFFGSAMALYIYAKIEKGNAVLKDIPVGLDLRTAAELLKYGLQNMVLAYETCVVQGWFKEAKPRELYWISVHIRS